MSEPPTLEETVHEVADAAVKVARGRTLPKILLTICAVIAALLVAGLMGARFGGKSVV